MRRNNRLVLAVGGIVLGVLLPLRAIAQDYSGINIFGDSLVDAGNLFNLTGFPPSPPYNKRFSNGVVWVEPLAEKLGLSPVLASEAVPGLLTGMTPLPTEGVNFALGGSFSSDQNVGPGLPGLEQQIGTFGVLSPVLPVASDDLFVLLAGGNDYNEVIPSLDLAAGPATVGQLADEVTNNLTSAASALVGLGAKHLLVANLPDLSIQPLSAQLDLFNPQISTLFSQVSTQHNKLLAQKLTGLSAATDAEITQLNLNELLAGITAAPAEFGFSNAEDSCLSASGVCSNPDEFVFWDDVHPTDAVHQIIADLAIETLVAKETGGETDGESGEPKSVPEPTGVVGLLLGAGLIVGVRRRAMVKLRAT